jgi:hypothetical protein
MNILYYPHKWNNSFLKKDVGYFPLERFESYKIVHNVFLLLFFLLKTRSIIVYHFSLKNTPIFILSFFFKYEIIIKTDLNNSRTKDISKSNFIRKKMYELQFKKADSIIIETKAEYNFFISTMKKSNIKFSEEKIIVQHNKVFTKTEYDLVKQKNTTLKKNQIIYYLRWNKNENYNENCGLDIFLKGIILNRCFFENNDLIIVGDTPNWLKEFISYKYKEITHIKFLDKLSRNAFIDLLIESKYYILTSRLESYNLTLVEAIICDCLIASTNTGVARDFDIDYINVDYPIYKFKKININHKTYVYNFN